MIELEGVTKRYGAALVVDDLSLAIPAGEFCVVIGSSGAGKSTTLRLINQLECQSAGAIRIGGEDVGGLPAAQLDVASAMSSNRSASSRIGRWRATSAPCPSCWAGPRRGSARAPPSF